MGAALLAAGGIYAFREQLGLVPDPAEDARKEVELLTGAINDMNAASIDTAMIGINAQLFELESQARTARQELEELQKESGSGALGLAPGTTGQRAQLQGQLGDIGAQRGALMAQQDRLQTLREGLDTAGEAGDRAGDSLDRFGKTVDDVVEKFQPMLNQDVENILSRAGEGSTIDENGQVRDAWGNFLPTLQRQLEAEVRDQQNAFTSEQNLQAGLEALIGGYTSTVPALMPTAAQESVPALAGNGGGKTTTIRFEVGDKAIGEAEGDDEFVSRLANALGSVASSV